MAETATVDRPRTRYSLDPDAAVVLPLGRLLPDRVVDRVLAPGRRRRDGGTTRTGTASPLAPQTVPAAG